VLLLPHNCRLAQRFASLAILTLVSPFSPALRETTASEYHLHPQAEFLLDQYCYSCHDGDVQKGDIRLDQIKTQSLEERLDLFNKMQEQLYFEEMPPKKEKDQPTAQERSQLIAWLKKELGSNNASTLEDKLRYPNYANYVDHQKLFSGEVKDVPYSPARRWLVSPEIFQERVLDVFGLEGRERDSMRRVFYGVNNPFILPDHSGVRYYDNTNLDGGHLLQMLSNAEWISEKQIHAARIKSGEIGPNDFSNPRDKWYPKITQPAFEAVISNQKTPTDTQIGEAIRTQFDLVLSRPPSDEEQAEYLKLTRSAIELGGNTQGLRRMLVTVLLESEFLYRLEFGDGSPDTKGRQILSPREASYAISYALGDRGPDAELIKSAQEGRLNTKEDYQREVFRLLADQNYYSGQIDSTLDGKHYSSNVTSHPKIIRFFREFFGYAGCLKVFKDEKRSTGKYGNPGRGSQATPGWLTLEADQIVTMHVENDKNVFENLLTSDEFFVYHNMENDAGKQLIEEWRGVYTKLKDSAWRTQPEKVLEGNLEFLKAQKSMRIADASKPGELVNFMHYFEESFGRGRTPFTRYPWSHGYTYHHSIFYSLPPTPSIGRYGSWKSTKVNDKIEEKEFWDYPSEQPFKIANRKGILTHPAWLIAHSTNFHSDAIRRGRWIREKLLAGNVPDVPITVDAQVPEDPHRTFRQRVDMVTKPNECWKCHQHMNPLGLAFEMYDDFGRFRTEEDLEHPDNLLKSGDGKSTFDIYKTLPVVTTGELSGTGDPALDGKVDDALDLIDRIARSERARQSIIRHAFRFYMGRNELLSDSKTLIDADRAYLKSGGSFKAVIVSLLTSDSFIYRKDT
jgi:hypothetical protein